MNLGVALAGGNGSRRADDYYPTPAEATLALLLRLSRYVGPIVHEPACGTGEMAEVIRSFGRRVIATDLIDRGYGRGGIDFLQWPPQARTIITNPPFNLADRFVEHAMSCEPEFFAMLLKATFWHAGKRVDLFERHPPKVKLPLAWRLDFTGGGAPTMDCTWFVWGSAVPVGLAETPLRKPTIGVFG